MRSFSAQMMSMDFAIRLPTCVTQKLIVAMGGMNRTVVQVHNNIIHCARMCTYVVYTYVSDDLILYTRSFFITIIRMCQIASRDFYTDNNICGHN